MGLSLELFQIELHFFKNYKTGLNLSTLNIIEFYNVFHFCLLDMTYTHIMSREIREKTDSVEIV